MNLAALQLKSLLQLDIEVAQSRISEIAPSSQGRLLQEALRLAVDDKTGTQDAVRLLGISQYILSGTYSLLSEERTIKAIDSLVSIASSDVSSELSNRATGVITLLLNRLRDSRSALSEQAKNFIHQDPPATNSANLTLLQAMRRRIQAADERAKARVERLSRRSFNLPDLDIKRAAKTVLEDAKGDWYQDPWGWPEIRWLAEEQPQKVVERLSTASQGWTVAIDVPKGNGNVRPGIVVNPLDRIAFQCLADEVSIEAAGNLPSWVHGWRLTRASNKRGIYESNHTEWRNFSNRVSQSARSFKFTAHLDVQSFFSSVDTDQLLSVLARRYRKAPVLDRLDAYLNGWHDRPNGDGIPQRSFASSVLSHIVLRPVDSFIDRLCNGGESGSFVASRWMDDIWLHSDSERELQKCLVEVEQILKQAGLGLNSEKSGVFPAAQIKKVIPGHSYLDNSDDDDADDDAVSLDDLLSATEGAPFMIGREIRHLLRHQKFGLFNSIKPDQFTNIAHLGNPFSKAFRVSGDWTRFTDIYINFAQQHISSENLTIATWGEMFPNDPTSGLERIHGYFSAQIRDDTRRLLTPLAAQRVASWGSKFGAQVLLDNQTLKDVIELDDPFRLRGVCFAALSAGYPYQELIKTLMDAGDNYMTSFLATHHSTPSLSRRFKSE